MSATLDHSTASPELGGAVCTACRAPLGSATRYCLSCGARQAGARSELLDLVPVSPAPVGPPAPPASVATLAATGPRTWPFAVTAAVLVALVVGLGLGRLLADGRGGSGDPPVIRIESVGGATAGPSRGAPASSDAASSGAASSGVAPPAGAAPSEAAPPEGASVPAPTASGAAE